MGRSSTSKITAAFARPLKISLLISKLTFLLRAFQLQENSFKFSCGWNRRTWKKAFFAKNYSHELEEILKLLWIKELQNIQ